MWFWANATENHKVMQTYSTIGESVSVLCHWEGFSICLWTIPNWLGRLWYWQQTRHLLSAATVRFLPAFPLQYGHAFSPEVLLYVVCYVVTEDGFLFWLLPRCYFERRSTGIPCISKFNTLVLVSQQIDNMVSKLKGQNCHYTLTISIWMLRVKYKTYL
jgi:hypothetical protein